MPLDVALVVEGGGMRAVVSAGMIYALMEAGICFPYVCGVSAGASIASSVLTDDPPRLRRSFVDLAGEKEFGGLRSFVRGQGYFNAHFIYEETALPGQALPFDFGAFCQSRMDFAIGAFRRDGGGMRWWHRKDIHSVRDMARVVRASSSLPLLMPPTWIGGVCYVDGGMGESIPISPAVAAGYRRFVVVRSQPRAYRKKTSRKMRLMRPAFGHHKALWHAYATRPARYNAEVAVLEELEAMGAAYVLAPEVMPFGREEMSVPALAHAWDLGLSQGRREVEAVRRFMADEGVAL